MPPLTSGRRGGIRGRGQIAVLLVLVLLVLEGVLPGA